MSSEMREKLESIKKSLEESISFYEDAAGKAVNEYEEGKLLGLVEGLELAVGEIEEEMDKC